MPDIFETILHRRSIRRFEPKQIEEAALQQILQAGLYAPSAGGRQGVIFAVCQDREAAGQPLPTLTDRSFCGSGTFPPITTPLCSSFWATPKRVTSTPLQSREKRGVCSVLARPNYDSEYRLSDGHSSVLQSMVLSSHQRGLCLHTQSLSQGSGLEVSP